MSRHVTLAERGFVLPDQISLFGNPILDRLPYWHPSGLLSAIRDFLCPEDADKGLPCHESAWPRNSYVAWSRDIGIINRQAELDGFTYQASFIGKQSEGMAAAIGNVCVCPAARAAVAGWIGLNVEQIWPNGWEDPASHGTISPRRPLDVSAVIASASAFRVAVDALPVGRDIRARLNVHIDTHIAAIEAFGGQA